MEPSKKPRDKKKFWKPLLFAGIPAAAAIVLAIVLPIVLNRPEPEEVTYQEFSSLVEQGQVERVEYTAGDPKLPFYRVDDETEYVTDNPKVEGFKERMLLAGVEFEENPPRPSGTACCLSC